MDIVSSIILGIVQGLTEFLPVSSSGHLILAREVFGIENHYGLAVDAVLQLATALALPVYFRKDFISLGNTAFSILIKKEVSLPDRTLLYALILGTIPAVILGLLLEEYMETAFRSAELVAWMLIAGSVLFLLAEKLGSGTKDLTLGRGLVIGLFQTLALIPGISRSGATISGGLLLGLSRSEAAKFGFLLSFPIIFGSGLKKLLELLGSGALTDLGASLLLSSSMAFLVGLLTIHYLLKYLRTHTLMVFVVYRVALASIVLLFLWL